MWVAILILYGTSGLLSQSLANQLQLVGESLSSLTVSGPLHSYSGAALQRKILVSLNCVSRCMCLAQKILFIGLYRSFLSIQVEFCLSFL